MCSLNLGVVEEFGYMICSLLLSQLNCSYSYVILYRIGIEMPGATLTNFL